MRKAVNALSGLCTEPPYRLSQSADGKRHGAYLVAKVGLSVSQDIRTKEGRVGLFARNLGVFVAHAERRYAKQASEQLLELF